MGPPKPILHVVSPQAATSQLIISSYNLCMAGSLQFKTAPNQDVGYLYHILSCRPMVLNLFLTADRATLDNFATDHPGSAQ